MSDSVTPEPASQDEPAGAGCFGALALDDLSNRAEKAYADHMEGYTASKVLHLLFMANLQDGELRTALDLVFPRIQDYHTKTRATWRQAYNTWAAAAGAEANPDDEDQAEDDGEGRAAA